VSVPKNHHYLPVFFVQRWAAEDGKVTEYRRPHDNLVIKQKHPAATGYMIELYANRNKTEPAERQALELVFMQKVDDQAANALAYLEEHRQKPNDPELRSGWSRFLMSLLHRSPERVKYLMETIENYENDELNKELKKKYGELRKPDDPATYEEWLEGQGPLALDLLVKLLRMLIDSERVGNNLNAMRWCVHDVEHSQFGFLTGDLPLMMSNGLGHEHSFIALAISPERLFVASHNQAIINRFKSRSANVLQRALNNACARQSQHVIIAQDDWQTAFVSKRLCQERLQAGPSGWPDWDVP
jgi:hypothetical protein